MGGKRKILTQTRRAALKKEMTEALLAGTFTTNGRPIDEVLDEVNQGIVEGRYPIEVDLATLLSIWSGNPAPTEAPAPEQPPTNHGTVDQQLAAQQNGHVPPAAQVMPVQQIPQPGPAEQAATQYPAVQPMQQDNGAGYAIPEQYPVVQQPSPLAAAAGVAPGQMIPTAVGMQPVQQVPGGQPMTFQQAQAAMSTVETMEVGQPPKEEPIQVDAAPVAEWLGLAKQAEEKIKALKDILEQAKANAAAYADQVGGPDRSKVLFLNGQLVMRRTFVRKNNFSKERLAAAHPEIDVTAFLEESTYYRTELV